MREGNCFFDSFLCMRIICIFSSPSDFYAEGLKGEDGAGIGRNRKEVKQSGRR